jgi:hypothetical protein
MYAYLLEADAWTGAAVETLRLGTHTVVTAPTEAPPNAVYEGRLSDAGSITRTLASGGTLGRASVSYGFLELVNASGALDAWYDYGFDGRAFALRAMPQRDMPVASAPVVFRGTLAGFDQGDALRLFRLRIRDRVAELAVPLLTERYAGTTVTGVVSASPTASDLAEGNTDLTDQLKALIFGRVANVAGRVANPFNLLWQFSARPVTSIQVYDGGVALTPRGDYPVIASLINASLSPGQFATCLDKGIARVGGTPAYTITADVVEGATASERTASSIVGRMLDVVGIPAADRDAASFAALDGFNAAECGIYLDADTTALDAIGIVLDSVGAAIAPTAQGVYQVLGLDAPDGAPAGTLTERDLVQGGSATLGIGPGEGSAGVPAWSVEVSYGRVYQTMTSGDLAGVVDLDRKTYLATGTRKAVAQDATIQTRHPLATSLQVDSLLANQADAQAEAARRLALYGTRRDLLTFPVAAERGDYELGEVVAVQMQRFGYGGAKLFRVVGREDDFSKRLIVLTLWG